jgi:hypothetical protein
MSKPEYKSKRVVIGTVYKPREGKETNGVQVNLWDKEFPEGTVTLTNKQYLNIERIDVQLKNLERAFADGKLEEEVYSKAKAKLEAKPDSIFAELTLYRND